MADRPARSQIAVLSVTLSFFAAAGCADPDACRVDDDCPGGHRCDVDEGVCVAVDGATEDGACTPSAERCDGRDNDCDGEVDEAGDLQARTVVGDDCGASDDACSAGRIACVDGGLSCVVHEGPSQEICNGADDDCDGDVDETFELGRRCVQGEGECRREGVTVCAADPAEGPVRCDAQPAAASEEACDNLDNDCDGEIDEGLADGGADAGQACSVGLGECSRTGVMQCTPGGVMACDAVEGGAGRRDLCNGRDEDCDGAVDEEFDINAPCWVGEGQCEREGTTRCTADADAACDATAGLGSAELCNSLDDDCDGATDEDFDAGDLCSVGVGGCRSQGVWACTEDGAGQLCNAEAPAQPGRETCNRLDDDCDGQTDEDFDIGAACSVGVGACQRHGQRVCGDGAFTMCPVDPGPRNAAELCDGVDDDCDAATDEDFDVGGFCRVGEGACVQIGALQCSLNLRDVDCDAVALAPAAETCNDVDDDCDGRTDEPGESLEFSLQGGAPAEAGTQLRNHDDGGFILASLAGPGALLSVASVDCAWSVAWRVDLPDSLTPLVIADAIPEEDGGEEGEGEADLGGIVILEGAADRSLVSVDADGPRWRLNLGPAAEIGGMAPYGQGYAIVVRDEVQLLDAAGRHADRWPHAAPAAADGSPTVPAIAAGPQGDLLLYWSDPATGDGILRRVDTSGEEVWTVTASSGAVGTSLTPRVRAIAGDGAVLLTGLLQDGGGVAAWLGIVDPAGSLVVERGSPFYAGCVGGVFASADSSEPVLRCVVPQRILFLHPDGVVRRSLNADAVAMSQDPFGAPSLVLLAERAAPGLVISRVARPE